MTGRIWSDEDLDAFMRDELSRMAAANPAPALDAAVRGRRGGRTRLLPVLPWSAAPDRPRRLAPLALGLAAALVFAGVGSWIGVHRLHGGVTEPAHRVQPTPRPAPPGGATLRSSVPTGVHVVYYMTARTNQDAEMEAVDWSGRHVGHLSVTSGQSYTGVISQSPDGQTLAVGTDLFTAQGSWLARPWTDNQSFTWSDDSRSLCYTTGAGDGGPTTLHVYTLGRGARTLATFAHPGYPYGCSGRNDRVLVVTQVPHAGQQPPNDSVVVYRMSTGAVVARHDYCATAACSFNLVYPASPNARWVAESHGNGTALRDVIANTSLPVAGSVVTFSADGTRAVMQVSGGTGAGRSVILVDTRDGHRIWEIPNTYANLAYLLFQPDGTHIAIGLDLDEGQGALNPTRLEILDLGSAAPHEHLVAPSIQAMATGPS
jgi:hypothetical protein